MEKPHFSYFFAKLHRLMLNICKEEISALGIQMSQMPFLIMLLREGQPLTQDDLSTALIIDKAATARALDQLEKEGFVARRINPRCRRQKLVTPTQKAQDMAERLMAILKSANDVFTRGFSEKELTIVHNLLNRMVTNATDEIQ